MAKDKADNYARVVVSKNWKIYENKAGELVIEHKGNPKFKIKPTGDLVLFLPEQK